MFRKAYFENERNNTVHSILSILYRKSTCIRSGFQPAGTNTGAYTLPSGKASAYFKFYVETIITKKLPFVKQATFLIFYTKRLYKIQQFYSTDLTYPI